MTITRSFALAAALALTALGAPGTTVVSIVRSAGVESFKPNPVTITSGDSVAWTNNDSLNHDIVLDDGSYRSGIILPGATSPPTRALTLDVNYHDLDDPTIGSSGRIIVSGACVYTILPTSASIAAAGGAGTVNVTVGAGCTWNVNSNNGFITVFTSPCHPLCGLGSGPFSYSVAANLSTAPRTGTVTINESAGAQTFTVSQAGASACPPIIITPPTLGTMTQGVAFHATVTASGGTAPYSFTVSSGALPAGLTLSSAGLLSGTPTTPGAATFTVHATDAGGCAADMPYSVTVLPSVPSLPQTVLILFALALVAAGWGSLGRRRGMSPS